jgi:polysaccharide export outer membrane protein
MKFKLTINVIFILVVPLLFSCTSAKKLAYLSNITQVNGEEYFTMEIPDYKIQNRDILYVTLKAMMPDGSINDFLIGNKSAGGGYYMQGESGSYLYGYDVNKEGYITLPVIGQINVAGKTLDEIRELLQEEFSKSYKNATVECKLLSFKFTVIGEVKLPGTYINYNNFLTVLEAVGRAGGISEYGKRDRVLVVRPTEKGTKTYRLNLQDKNILSSEAYFLLPNDVVIVEPQKSKVFNMNLPTISFILTSITSTVSMLILILSFTK